MKDDGLPPPLADHDAVTGTRVKHRRGQWLAMIAYVQLPWCWIVYDADRARGCARAKRVLRTALARAREE